MPGGAQNRQPVTKVSLSHRRIHLRVSGSHCLCTIHLCVTGPAADRSIIQACGLGARQAHNALRPSPSRSYAMVRWASDGRAATRRAGETNLHPDLLPETWRPSPPSSRQQAGPQHQPARPRPRSILQIRPPSQSTAPLRCPAAARRPLGGAGGSDANLLVAVSDRRVIGVV